MTTIKEIQTAIESLPQKEYKRLMEWIQQREEERWDKQIAQASEVGKLDILVKEARSDYLLDLEIYERKLAQGEINW